MIFSRHAKGNTKAALRWSPCVRGAEGNSRVVYTAAGVSGWLLLAYYSTYVLRKLPIHILYTACFASDEQKELLEVREVVARKQKRERERESLRSVGCCSRVYPQLFILNNE